MIASIWRGAAHAEDVERAVVYPEDDRFLVERALAAEHYEVVPAVGTD